MLNRRHFLSSALVLGLGSRVYADDLSLEGNTSLQNMTPNLRQGGCYGLMGGMGPYGYPDKPLYSEPVPGLRLLLYVPPNCDSMRVLIFSHAERYSPEDYNALFKHYASHGFLVLAPVHRDSPMVTNSPYHSTLMSTETLVNDRTLWASRLADCSSSLDFVPSLSRTLRVSIKTDRPIIAGHLLGSFIASILVGGQTKDLQGHPFLHKDPRFYAGLFLSPYGHGTLGQDSHSWDNITCPIMVVSGIGDNDTFNEDVSLKSDPYYLSPPTYKHLAWFQKIWAPLYTGDNISPDSPTLYIFEDLLAISTTYLTAYADYDATILQNLSGDYFAKATQNRVGLLAR